MKQTAVQWLIEHLNLDETSPNYNKLIIEQAKEMEKEQIINAWDKRGDRIVPKYFLKENITGEQYYNETFKQQ
jgi:hypothetical protein